MKAPNGMTIQDSIEKLQAEIERLVASSKMMRDANLALQKDDVDALRSLGFSEAHISDLKARLGRGRDGFPAYVLRNNDSGIRCLKKSMAQLKAAISVRQ